MKHHLLVLVRDVVADDGSTTYEEGPRLIEVNLPDDMELGWMPPTPGTQWKGFGSTVGDPPREGFVEHYVDGVLVERGIWPQPMQPVS